MELCLLRYWNNICSISVWSTLGFRELIHLTLTEVVLILQILCQYCGVLDYLQFSTEGNSGVTAEAFASEEILGHPSLLSPKGSVFYIFTSCCFLHLHTILATLYQKFVAADYFLWWFVASYRVVAVADYCLSRHLQVTGVPWSSATASDNMISYWSWRFCS